MNLVSQRKTPPPARTLDAVYREHGASVMRRARSLMGTEQDARDVLQDIFMSLHERPAQYAGQSSWTTFLYSATTHACLNKIRNRKNRLRLVEENMPTQEDDEIEKVLSPEQLSQLHQALRLMPDELAAVAVYYCADDLSHDEISKLMNCSRRHVGNLLTRLRQWEQDGQTPC